MECVLAAGLLLILEQCGELPDDFIARVIRQARRKLCPARSPVQALDLIGEYDAFYRQLGRKANLEGVSLGSTRDGAEQGEPNLPVIRPWRDDDGRAPPSLLVSCLRVQGDPNDVPAVRDVGLRQLPDFPTCDRARLHLRVTIPLRDPRQELFQMKSGVRESKAQLAVLQGDFHLCGRPQPGALSERLRNSNREAVSPLLNSGSHVRIYIEYTKSAAAFRAPLKSCRGAGPSFPCPP